MYSVRAIEPAEGTRASGPHRRMYSKLVFEPGEGTRASGPQPLILSIGPTP